MEGSLVEEGVKRTETALEEEYKQVAGSSLKLILSQKQTELKSVACSIKGIFYFFPVCSIISFAAG